MKVGCKVRHLLHHWPACFLCVKVFLLSCSSLNIVRLTWGSLLLQPRVENGPQAKEANSQYSVIRYYESREGNSTLRG